MRKTSSRVARIWAPAGLGRHQRLLDQQCQCESRCFSTHRFLPSSVAIAEAFRPWGVRLAISVDFGSPQKLGRPRHVRPARSARRHVVEQKVDELYQSCSRTSAASWSKPTRKAAPVLASYGRTHADAANVIARALQPHGGLLFYRSFVYDHHIDWHNPKMIAPGPLTISSTRSTANSPTTSSFKSSTAPSTSRCASRFRLYSAACGKQMKRSSCKSRRNTRASSGISCFLVPMWKEILDFDMRNDGQADSRARSVAGASLFIGRPADSSAWLTSGCDANWLGHPLAMANLYGFGRLAWNPDLTVSANCGRMDASDVRQ